MTLRFVATRASAFVPIAMSLAAIGVLAAALFLGWGRSPDGDEGAAAHLWQLLMAGQIPIIGYFIVRWVVTDPRDGLPILAAQLGAGLAAAAPVFLLHL
jgi:hypothetical protein